MLLTRQTEGLGRQTTQQDATSEQVVFWTIVLTPIWWLLGVQIFVYPAVVILLLLPGVNLKSIAERRLPGSVWTWFAMALTMLLTAFIGLESVNFDLSKVIASAVNFFKGYFFIFACLVLPFFRPVRSTIVTRAVAWMATSYLATFAVQLVLFSAGIFDNSSGRAFKSLLATLIPGANSGSLDINMIVGVESFLGIPLPRTTLYTPDPPILGLCAILCFLICLAETNTTLRRWALAGALVALVFSTSRSAWIAFPIALALSTLADLRRRAKVGQGVLWLGVAFSLVCGLSTTSPNDILDGLFGTFNQARVSSSQERNVVVGQTLQVWQESPWLGWGFIQHGARFYEGYKMPLGTFSTYANALYLHGVLGFCMLITTMLWTFWDCGVRAWAGDVKNARALGCLFSLYLISGAEVLTWMSPFLWFFFVWLGAVLKESQAKTPFNT
jgi:O-Antigen ligase